MGKTVETVADFIFGGSKITFDDDCSHEIKRCLLLGRTSLDSILKSRHYFVNKGPSSQGYGFSSGHVWMWELDYKENWVPKNWCFWNVVLEKTLKESLGLQRDPTSQSSRKSVLNIQWKDWCWSWNSNTFATWCKEVTYWKRPWCWERLKARGEGNNRGWDGLMASPTRWTWVWVDFGSWWWTGGLECCGSWGCKELDMTEWLNWLKVVTNNKENF